MEIGIDNPALNIDLEDVEAEDRAKSSSLGADEQTKKNGTKKPITFETNSPEKEMDVKEEQSDSEESDGDKENVSCSFIGEGLEKFWKLLSDTMKKHPLIVRAIVFITLAVLYNAYFIASIVYAISNDIAIDYCDGVGLLIILTIVLYVGLFYFQIVKPFFGRAIYKSCLQPMQNGFNRLWEYRVTRYGFYLILLAILVVFLVLDTADDRSRLISFLGLVCFLLFGWIFSKHPSKVIWRQVVWGIALQFIFGLIVLRWDIGRDVFNCVGNKVSTFLDYTLAGSGFVYGYLATDENSAGIKLGTVFAFKVLSVIFFFSFTISILYYYGVMQWLVKKIGWLLQISLGTTAAESMNASANIFLGQTEAPLLIKPYLPLMTKSELHAVMTGGFATIAGSVLAAYISFGIDAAHLLSASVMSAPAALAYSKLFYPESEKSRTTAKDIKMEKGKEANALDAAAQGAANAVFLILNISANLVAFLAFVAFLNGVISWFGGLVGAPYVTFEYIMAKIFYPVAWIMGVPSQDCELVGNLIALKTIVNEFAGYSKLSEYIKQGLLTKRSEIISTYALCGFSNPGSIGCQIAALATMAPNRQSDLAQVAFRAFVAGSIACFMTACIAGTLVSAPAELVTTTTSFTPSFTPNVTALFY